MLPRLFLPLGAVALFCLTAMGDCSGRNKVPAGQLTVAQGYVVNIRTGRPLPGVLVALVSEERGPRNYRQTQDTVRTNRQGHYTIGFTNEAGLYYTVDCEGIDANYYQYRLDFADSASTQPPHVGTVSLRSSDLTLGQTNVVKFRASPRRVFRVRVDTRTTGYSQLAFANATRSYPADNQHFTVVLYQVPRAFASTSQEFAQQVGVPPGIVFSRRGANGYWQDTTVLAVPTTAPTADTVEATLRLGR